jgi:hypothetical protein
MINTSEIKSEMDEGPTAQNIFTNAMKKILSVSHEEMLRREAEYKKQVAANPRKRGPKPKSKAK